MAADGAARAANRQQQRVGHQARTRWTWAVSLNLKRLLSVKPHTSSDNIVELDLGQKPHVAYHTSPRVHLHVMGMLRVYVFDINQPSLPTPFYSVLVSVSVFMALSTVFHSISSPDNFLCMALSTVFHSINYRDNSPLSHSVLLVLFCFIGPFKYISLYESIPQL